MHGNLSTQKAIRFSIVKVGGEREIFRERERGGRGGGEGEGKRER